MANIYEIELDNGCTEKVVFNNYFLRLLSRLISDDKAKTVEETISSIFSVVNAWQSNNAADSHSVYSDFDKICSGLIPVVCAGSNAYKELNGMEEDSTLKSAEKILNHVEITGLVGVLNGLVECIIPKGLPQDKKKEGAEEK